MKITEMKGITLVELLVVIAIIAIIAGFASLSADLIRRERVSSATRELYADLQKLRLDSMTQEGKGFGIRLESANTYVLFKFDDCDEDYSYDTNSCAGGTREEIPIIRKNFNSSVALYKTNPFTGVDNEVRIFDRFGSPRRDTGGLGPITIILKSVPDAGLLRCVVLSQNRIREAVWNGSECI